MYFYSFGRASSAIYSLAKENPGLWIIPDNSCHVLAAAILSAGSIPIIADIDPLTFSIKLSVCERLVQSHSIKGVIWVRTYGNNHLDYEGAFCSLKDLSDQLIVVDDRCLCFPVLDKPDSQADVVLFSTGYGKPVDISYGGFCFSKIPLQNHPMQENFSSIANIQFEEVHKSLVKEKSFLSEIHGQVVLSKWIHHVLPISQDAYIDLINSKIVGMYEHKQKLNDIYSSINSNLVLGPNWNTWRFQLLVANPDELLVELFRRGLFASSHYYPLSSLYKIFCQLPKKHYYWPSIYSLTVNLFNDLRYTQEMAFETVSVVNDYALPVQSDIIKPV